MSDVDYDRRVTETLPSTPPAPTSSSLISQSYGQESGLPYPNTSTPAQSWRWNNLQIVKHSDAGCYFKFSYLDNLHSWQNELLSCCYPKPVSNRLKLRVKSSSSLKTSSYLQHTSTQGSDSKPDSSLIWHVQNEDKWWAATDTEETKGPALPLWCNSFLDTSF